MSTAPSPPNPPAEIGVDAHDASGISANASQFSSQGDRFVAQYIDDNSATASTGGSPSLTTAQVQKDAAAGLSIVSIYQTNGMSSAGGSTAYQTYFTHQQGAMDGTEALESAEALGQPPGSTIYFAFDFNPAILATGQTETQLLTSVQTYLTVVSQVFANSGYKIGVYGAGDTLAAVIRNDIGTKGYTPVATQGWLTQSYGWAGSGSGDANAAGWAIYQQYDNPNGSTTQNGVSVDRDDATTTALGQWMCFGTGTLIRTSRGDVAVETLMVGDLVLTASGEHRPIRWLGHRTMDCASRPTPSDAWPVRILAGAFGQGLPDRNLLLSPGHPVLVGADENGTGGYLVPVMLLINGTSVARVPVDTVTYWHVELDAHDILLAEGLPAESFLDYGNRPWFEKGGDHDLLHPDYVAPGLAGRCRPVAFDGPVVEAERRRLDALFATSIAAQCDWPTDMDQLAL